MGCGKVFYTCHTYRTCVTRAAKVLTLDNPPHMRMEANTRALHAARRPVMVQRGLADIPTEKLTQCMRKGQNLLPASKLLSQLFGICALL